MASLLRTVELGHFYSEDMLPFEEQLDAVTERTVCPRNTAVVNCSV